MKNILLCTVLCSILGSLGITVNFCKGQDLPEPYFTEITTEAGLIGTPSFRIAIADINGDGYPDLFLHANTDEATQDVFKKQRIFLNLQCDDSDDPTCRVFVDFTEESGIWANRRNTDEGRHSDLALLGDFDNDGDLDYFAGLYFHRLEDYTDTGDRNDLMLNDGQGHFTFADDLTLFNEGLINTSAAALVDYDKDGLLDLWVGNWFLDYAGDIKSPDFLYRGFGDGSFENVTQEANLDVTQPSYGVAVADTDGDGWPDLFAANYCRDTSKHFHNNQDGTFTEISETSHYGEWVGPIKSLCSWGSMPRDYDNDGDIDLFEILTHGNKNYHSCPLVNNEDVFTWDFASVNRTGDPNPRHHGDHYGSWIDYDNNGIPDFIITECGYDNNHIYLFQQEADHTFNVITEKAGLEIINELDLPAHNASAFDFDLDGDEDLIFGFSDDSGVRLFRNDVGNLNNWVIVALTGAGMEGKSNRCAIGAKVAVTAGGITQTRVVQAGSGHFSPEMPLWLNFGLNQAEVIDQIKVTWPNIEASETILTQVPINQIVKISEIPTETPTPTEAPKLGIRLEMPQDYYSPSDLFKLTAYLGNPDAPMTNVPMFVLLEIAGQYWYWDDWSEDIDFNLVDVPTGITTLEIMPEFTWPDTGDAALDGIRFYGCMLNEDMNAILGDMDGLSILTWGFGPEK